MDSIGKKLGRVAMPEIMKAHSWEILYPAYQVREFVGQAPWLLRVAVLSAAHQRLSTLTSSESQQRFSLLAPQTAKLSDGESGERDRTGAIGFGCLEPDARLGLFQAFHHAQHSTIEVNIFPAKRQNLTASHSSCQGKQYRAVDVHVPDRVQQTRRLLNRERSDLLSRGFRESLFECVCWIARQQLLLDRAGKGGPKDDMEVPTREW